MIAKDLISEVVPLIRTTDTGIKALNWMEIFRVSHLPIVGENEFIGLISDKDIYDLNISDNEIGEHKLSLFRPYVTENQHIYEIIELVSRLKLSVVPVLSKKNKYLGVISLHDLVKYFSQITGAGLPGAIIIMKMDIKDYSISQISHIIESDNAKVLSLYVSPKKQSPEIKLTIKLNTVEITGIKQSLERYGYQIIGSYSENDKMNKLLEERYEEFMNYLEI